MSKANTARVVLTTECPRGCADCVNNYPGMLDQAVPFKRPNELLAFLGEHGYKSACLTGGEPMLLMPSLTMYMAGLIKSTYPQMLVYVYMSAYRDVKDLLRLKEFADGAHYTLHAMATPRDMSNFYAFQGLVWPEGSRRLYIHPNIGKTVNLVPDKWSRVEMKPWLGPGECRLPDNEDLYIWRQP